MSKSIGLAWARWSASASIGGLFGAVASTTASILDLGLLVLSQDNVGLAFDANVVSGVVRLAAFEGLAQRDRATRLPVEV